MLGISMSTFKISSEESGVSGPPAQARLKVKTSGRCPLERIV